MRRGMRGLEFGGKAHILDAMNICNSIWNRDGKWATEDGIRRCWRKANILPLEQAQEIDADIGRSRVAAGRKCLAKEDCDELCGLMRDMIVKSRGANIQADAVALKGSFAEEQQFDRSELEEMADEWIGIEEDSDIIEEEVTEEFQKLLDQENVMELDDVDLDSEPEPIDEEEVEAQTLTVAEAEEMVWTLKKAAAKFGMGPQSIGHLENFVRDLRKMKNEAARKDTTMHSFFSTVTSKKQLAKVANPNPNPKVEDSFLSKW